MAAFWDELLKNAQTYAENRHEKLNREIQEKLGKGAILHDRFRKAEGCFSAFRLAKPTRFIQPAFAPFVRRIPSPFPGSRSVPLRRRSAEDA
ncbi:MAG: hypothetical protein LBQ15_07990 [Clostridium sp.]|nr:hypothetical protein [Clostridium sp.]